MRWHDLLWSPFPWSSREQAPKRCWKVHFEEGVLVAAPSATPRPTTSQCFQKFLTRNKAAKVCYFILFPFTSQCQAVCSRNSFCCWGINKPPSPAPRRRSSGEPCRQTALHTSQGFSSSWAQGGSCRGHTGTAVGLPAHRSRQKWKHLSVLVKLISQVKSSTYVETEDFQSSAFIIKNVLKLVTILYLAYFPIQPSFFFFF